MRILRTGTPTKKEMWDVAEIMNYLNCDEVKARRILKSYHDTKCDGYGKVEKAMMLDYIENIQREEREREARYKSDLATVESIAVLKEQVKTLKESCMSSSDDARKARLRADVSNIIAVIALAVAIVGLCLN